MGIVKQKKDTKQQRQIAFDLDIARLKEYYPKPQNSINEQHYTHAYDDIRSFMRKNGFKHRQGSVYVSKEKVTRSEVHHIVENMAIEMPWLYKCVNAMDLTIVQKTEQDLTGIIADATLDYLQKLEVLDVDPVAENIQDDIELLAEPEASSIDSLIQAAEERRTESQEEQKDPPAVNKDDDLSI